MPKIKRPLKQSILTGAAIFIILLCILLGCILHFSLRKQLRQDRETRITEILCYTAARIDADEFSSGISPVASREQLQSLLDGIEDHFQIRSIYVIDLSGAGSADSARTVTVTVASGEAQNRENPFSPEFSSELLKAGASGELSFFSSSGEADGVYTGVLPLFDSRGSLIAALCVDVGQSELRAQLLRGVLTGVGLTVVIGIVFLAAFMAWATHTVTKPIERLEAGVTDYVAGCRGQRDPESFSLDLPLLRTGNELETLSRAVHDMSSVIQRFAGSIQSTEAELARMTVLANKDALTMVRNNTAFESYKQELSGKLLSGDTSFAVLMIDLNDLKKVNDTYGHDKGDLYIIKNCKLICDEFNHSPVFRVGGDEFVAILMNHDFDHRFELVNNLREIVRSSAFDTSINPWDRYSVAVGMAAFQPETDSTLDDVIKRADMEMYDQKTLLKESLAAL